jgi:uncharacterized repeat protein (TIGR03806 family)
VDAVRALVLLALLALPAAAEDYRPPRKLSEWKLFEGGGATQKPAPGVIAYDVNVPLFSDHADKHRFVRLPPGAKATYKAEGPFDFPVGTVLVKTFAYAKDKRDPSKGERLLETRLLVRRPTGWIGLPYVWDEAQSEATLRYAGGAVDGVSWTHGDGSRRTLRYLIPNANQCKGCHEAKGRGKMAPLGTTAANLNGRGQLEAWKKAGALAGLPAKAPAFPLWHDKDAPLALKARAYLDVNCAHCHNPSGPADTAGIDLRFSQNDPIKLGIGKPPVAAGIGTGGRPLDIVPGHPEKSILLFRMESVVPGVMMPELGRRVTDEEGVAVVRQWIASLGAPR